MKALVSIVMPSLNQGKYIQQAIDSVLEQDYQKIELIIADGGSTDGTLELLHQYTDSRLRWQSEQDLGPADALNKALAMTRGTIIGWLNSDDCYMPGAISRAVMAFEENRHWIMVYGHAQHIDELGSFLEYYPSKPPNTQIEDFINGCFICQPSVFFKRSLFILNGKLDIQLKTAFDFDYWLRTFQKFRGRIGFIEQLQAQSRLYEDCITRSMRMTVFVEGIYLIHKYLKRSAKDWALNYIDELLESTVVDKKKDAEVFMSKIRPYFADEIFSQLEQSVRCKLNT